MVNTINAMNAVVIILCLSLGLLVDAREQQQQSLVNKKYFRERRLPGNDKDHKPGENKPEPPSPPTPSPVVSKPTASPSFYVVSYEADADFIIDYTLITNSRRALQQLELSSLAQVTRSHIQNTFNDHYDGAYNTDVLITILNTDSTDMKYNAVVTSQVSPSSELALQSNRDESFATFLKTEAFAGMNNINYLKALQDEDLPIAAATFESSTNKNDTGKNKNDDTGFLMFIIATAIVVVAVIMALLVYRNRRAAASNKSYQQHWEDEKFGHDKEFVMDRKTFKSDDDVSYGFNNNKDNSFEAKFPNAFPPANASFINGSPFDKTIEIDNDHIIGASLDNEDITMDRSIKSHRQNDNLKSESAVTNVEVYSDNNQFSPTTSISYSNNNRHPRAKLYRKSQEPDDSDDEGTELYSINFEERRKTEGPSSPRRSMNSRDPTPTFSNAVQNLAAECQAVETIGSYLCGADVGGDNNNNVTTMNANINVTAPKGKLGLFLRGNEVYQMKSESPLRSVVREGDLLVSINGIDTTKKDAVQISKLLAKTSAFARQLRIHRPSLALEEEEEGRPSGEKFSSIVMNAQRSLMDKRTQSYRSSSGRNGRHRSFDDDVVIDGLD